MSYVAKAKHNTDLQKLQDVPTGAISQNLFYITTLIYRRRSIGAMDAYVGWTKHADRIFVYVDIQIQDFY
jgi:hypothetical protein